MALERGSRSGPREEPRWRNPGVYRPGTSLPEELTWTGSLPDPASAVCARLITNMSYKQWREWVSPDIDYFKACPDLPVPPD